MADTIWDDIAKKVADTVAGLTPPRAVACRLAFDASLVDNGFSSLVMVDLMLAVESVFDMTIPQHELLPANFVSMRTLTSMLTRLCSVKCEAMIAWTLRETVADIVALILDNQPDDVATWSDLPRLRSSSRSCLVDPRVLDS